MLVDVVKSEVVDVEDVDEAEQRRIEGGGDGEAEDQHKCKEEPRDLESRESRAPPAEKQEDAEEALFECELCNAKLDLASTFVAHMREHNRQQQQLENEEEIDVVDAQPPRESEVMALTMLAPSADAAPNDMLADKTIWKLRWYPFNPFGSPIRRPYVCNVCGGRFSRESVLRVHNMEAHADVDRRWRCKLCLVTFVDQADMKEHVRSHIMDRPLECRICKKHFKLPRLLHRHYLGHLGVKPFKCGYCSRRYNRKSDLSRHVKRHEQPCSCGLCGRDFASKTHLDAHVWAEHGRGPYGDDAHKKRKHAGDGLPAEAPAPAPASTFTTAPNDPYYYCNACKKRFVTILALSVHQRTHQVEKGYRCDRCPAKFTKNVALLVHQRKHKLRRPHKCDSCKLTFRQEVQLKLHVYRVHGGAKPFRCAACGEEFLSAQPLNKHKRAHLEEERIGEMLGATEKAPV